MQTELSWYLRTEECVPQELADAYSGYVAKNNHGAKNIWYGKQAEKLGLTGNIDAQTFEQVLLGKPYKGFVMADTAKRHSVYATAFYAPRGLGTAYASSKDENLIYAHDDAVKKAVDHIEKIISECHEADSVIFAIFRHLENVTERGGVMPAIVTHVLFFTINEDEHGNFVHNDISQWSASLIMADIHAIYRAELAFSLLVEWGYMVDPWQKLARATTDEILSSGTSRGHLLAQMLDYLDSSL